LDVLVDITFDHHPDFIPIFVIQHVSNRDELATFTAVMLSLYVGFRDIGVVPGGMNGVGDRIGL